MLKCSSCNWIRLQNSPYFCIFKYARAVKQKVWNDAENRDWDWVETLKCFFFLSPPMPYGRVRLARFARIRLLHHALLILWKNRLFCSLQMNLPWECGSISLIIWLFPFFHFSTTTLLQLGVILVHRNKMHESFFQLTMELSLNPILNYDELFQ